VPTSKEIITLDFENHEYDLNDISSLKTLRNIDYMNTHLYLFNIHFYNLK